MTPSQLRWSSCTLLKLCLPTILDEIAAPLEKFMCIERILMIIELTDQSARFYSQKNQIMGLSEICNIHSL